MNQPLPQATLELAKAVWDRQRAPSARSVARALTQAGLPIHYVTVNRWRKWNWRADPALHPVDQARADLDAALPLLTGDPRTTIEDLVEESPDKASLEKLADGELLRKPRRRY
jgi:hypothetical protein